MSYNITCSTKILTLAITSFLFILVDVLCEFVVGAGCVLSNLLLTKFLKFLAINFGSSCSY